MRVGRALLGVMVVLIGSSTAHSSGTLPVDTGVSTPHSLNVAPQAAIAVNKTVLRSHADGEERSPKAAIAKIDELVDPAKLDAALGDLTKMKALFKQWNADATMSNQVIARLSGDRQTFAKYSSLVLTFNGYRVKAAESAAKLLAQKKTVDALVNPTKLNIALKDTTQMKSLFKQWNVNEDIAMQVINRLASNPQTLTTYSPLVLHFNVYRMRMAEKAAMIARNAGAS